MSTSPPAGATELTTNTTVGDAGHPRRRASWAGLFRALWPVQRAVLLVCLAGVLLVVAGMFWYRQWSNGVLADIRSSPVCLGPAGSDAPDCASELSDALFYRLRTPATLLQLACAALTAGGGVLLGVSAFARDFEQRTQVLLLSQSVSRGRWWTAKLAIVGVPWVLAMVPLGAAATLSLRDEAAYMGDAMDPARYYFSPWSLPLIALVGLGVGAAVSTVLRSTLGALLVAALLTTALIVGSEFARPHLVPTTRLISAPEVFALSEAPAGSWFRGTGYLDAQGNEMQYGYACPSLDAPNPTEAEIDRWMADCLRQSGITAGYTDVIEPQWFGPLRLLWSGLLVVVSAVVLLAGFLRIRRRII